MPNWTMIELEADGIESLPIFTIDPKTGNKDFDYNKLVPMPEIANKTSSPVRTEAIMHYLLCEYPTKEEAIAKYIDYARHLPTFTGADEVYFDEKENAWFTIADCKSATREYLIEATKANIDNFMTDGMRTTNYDLGKAYIEMYELTGCWDWYDWACKNWGVKWNASETTVEPGLICFYAPWDYPEGVFRKLAKRFPEKQFKATIRFEDDGYETALVINFAKDDRCLSGLSWDEYSARV